MSRNAEAKIQAAIVAYVRAVAPDVLCFAVPNGGLRTKSEAALLKWTGVLAGIPDLILVLPGGGMAAWEVKTPSGVLSKDQQAVWLRLMAMGTPRAVVRSVDDARRELAALGIETRERIAA